jgi:hypothetical protein
MKRTYTDSISGIWNILLGVGCYAVAGWVATEFFSGRWDGLKEFRFQDVGEIRIPVPIGIVGLVTGLLFVGFNSCSWGRMHLREGKSLREMMAEEDARIQQQSNEAKEHRPLRWGVSVGVHCVLMAITLFSCLPIFGAVHGILIDGLSLEGHQAVAAGIVLFISLPAMGLFLTAKLIPAKCSTCGCRSRVCSVGLSKHGNEIGCYFCPVCKSKEAPFDE